MSVFRYISIFVSFLIIFFGNYLFYGVLSAEFFESHAGTATNVQKEDVDMTFIALGCLVQGWILTTLYEQWSRGKHQLIKGFLFGATVGIFTGFGMGFVMYGTTNMFDLNAYLLDGIWQVALYGIAGAAISGIMNRSKAKD